MHWCVNFYSLCVDVDKNIKRWFKGNIWRWIGGGVIKQTADILTKSVKKMKKEAEKLQWSIWSILLFLFSFSNHSFVFSFIDTSFPTLLHIPTYLWQFCPFLMPPFIPNPLFYSFYNFKCYQVPQYFVASFSSLCQCSYECWSLC